MLRGRSFFEAIYSKITRPVMGHIDPSGTEDLGLLARLMYGYIPSNATVLSSAETLFVMNAGLIPQDVNPHLIRYLKGALNGGATVEQVRAVRHVVLELCQAAGMRILDASAPAGFGWRYCSGWLLHNWFIPTNYQHGIELPCTLYGIPSRDTRIAIATTNALPDPARVTPQAGSITPEHKAEHVSRDVREESRGRTSVSE
ncbi:hypothetical protein N657DRAFT_211773 [Parathielavia appendiculata]|uniref:Uncharacterized protein n=1 Tax=Parathielavia appendiculata TaxID=2587402 RepID=A0AAN6U9F7_9PEZI|nr:hypothetical protein N657DRAFT_211773 [Parathielavia appendiculata]